MPAQERGSQKLRGCWILTSSLLLKGSQKLLGVLDAYVLCTFKGIQQRGALPAQERGSQKLRGCQPRREAPTSCRGCWILTSSLLLKEFSREEPCQARRERLPEAAAGAGSLRPPYF